MSGRVGSSPRRVGGHGRVTGEQRYVADIGVPGVLHAKLVTLDCARARIVSIDTTAAEHVPGVRLVMTPADLPAPGSCPSTRRRPNTSRACASS